MQIISIIKAISFVNARSFSKWVAKGLIGILLIAICFAKDVQADPGDLDTSFSFDGKVTTDFGISFALAIQADGKIVAAGYSDTPDGGRDFALARYNTDGSLDVGFGSGGIVLTNFSGGRSKDLANALAIQADGKIVAAGESDASGSTDFALARYNTDGSLDVGFGSGGMVLTDFSGGGSFDRAQALALQADGKIVAAGFSEPGGSFGFALALARYLDSVPAPTPSPTPMPGLEPGDANGDGEINILDVTVILNDILEISSAPGNGDCNEDGEVDILDVTCVLNIIFEG
jgi:uncharacterized delta-60 repeat protein